MLFTLILSVYGPIHYVDYEFAVVVLYVLVYMVLFAVAYIYGVNKIRRVRFYTVSSGKYKLVMKAIKLSLIISTAYYIILLVVFLAGGGSFDVSKAGQSYVDLYADYERGSGSHSLQFISSIFVHPFYMISLILGSYYFFDLSKSYKTMLLAIIIIELMVNAVGYGKMKYVGDLIIFISIAGIVRSYGSKNVNGKVIASVFSLGVVGIIILVYLLHLRYAAMDIGFNNIASKSHPLMNYETQGLLAEFEFGFAIAALSQYITQGWYGLSLALQLPFVWTYGFGNSYSMMIVYDRFLFGESLLDLSYPYRVGEAFGWGDRQDKWYSWFTWVASDVSFLGVLLLAIPMGYVYGTTWRESVEYRNPVSIFLFSLLTLGLVFLPANNQLLHTPNGVLVFFIAVLMWVFTKHRFNFISDHQ